MNEEQLTSLLEHYARTHDPALRDALLEGYLPVARSVARKFSGRGAETEDLEQVASIALLKALDRFEPERGFRFVTYAVPTITGEVRNYLRDAAGALRMPRDLRSRLHRMQQHREAFEREEMRAPTADELAERMGIPREELLTLLLMRESTETVSMDMAVGDEDEAYLRDMIGGPDRGYEDVERREWMQWVLSKVNDTERELLMLRFRDGLGQRDTAKRMGVSQMQVSRLERRMLARLRAMETST